MDMLYRNKVLTRPTLSIIPLQQDLKIESLTLFVMPGTKGPMLQTSNMLFPLVKRKEQCSTVSLCSMFLYTVPPWEETLVNAEFEKDFKLLFQSAERRTCLLLWALMVHMTEVGSAEQTPVTDSKTDIQQHSKRN